LFNESLNYKYKDFNSGNLKFLSFEKNTRLTANNKIGSISKQFSNNGVSFLSNEQSGFNTMLGNYLSSNVK
jgi:hypothetical protein